MSNITVRDANNQIVSIPITPIGQTTATNSLSVVIASDQTNVPVSLATSNTTINTSDTGTAITGASIPSGGSGVIGWLSAIWKVLTTSVLSIKATGLGYTASGLNAIGSNFTATGQSAVFTPLAGRSFNVSVYGTFVGIVQLERSFNGTDYIPVKTVRGDIINFQDPESFQYKDDQVGVTYRLNCVSYTSGTIYYYISQ